jgi:hypothetical protein
MLFLANVGARSDEATGGSREQIIQGVRDDVRRKIQERNEIPAENRAETASTGTGKLPATAPGNAGQDTAKQDTPK